MELPWGSASSPARAPAVAGARSSIAARAARVIAPRSRTPSTPPTPTVVLASLASAAPQARTDESSDVSTRVRIAVPDPRVAILDRWIAGREGPSTFLVDDAVLLCVSLRAGPLEHFLQGPIEL